MSFGKRVGSAHENEQDFELNLASIIDCFTVLIAFMLASASFLSVGILDAGVAAAGKVATTDKPAPVNVAVELKKDFKMQVKITGSVQRNHELVNGTGKSWDMEALTQRLKQIKGEWAGVSAITLLADNQVEYRDVVQVMETVRKEVPVVLLGGF